MMTEIPKHHATSFRNQLTFTKITLCMFLTVFFLRQFKGHNSTYISLKSKAETLPQSHDSIHIKYCDVQNKGMRSKKKGLGVTNTTKDTD